MIGNKAEPLGEEVKAYTSRKLARKTIWLTRDVSEIDPLGRALRYVWIVEPPAEPKEDDVRKGMFNAWLLLEGYAYAASNPPDVLYAEVFTRFEKEARDAKRGIWGGVGSTPAEKAEKSEASRRSTN
ncbi:MAG: thermonuclease family protein [Firmicutes bacterium]|nr:thermonuclease family protein [Bacillota bacterium]